MKKQTLYSMKWGERGREADMEYRRKKDESKKKRRGPQRKDKKRAIDPK